MNRLSGTTITRQTRKSDWKNSTDTSIDRTANEVPRDCQTERQKNKTTRALPDDPRIDCQIVKLLKRAHLQIDRSYFLPVLCTKYNVKNYHYQLFQASLQSGSHNQVPLPRIKLFRKRAPQQQRKRRPNWTDKNGVQTKRDENPSQTFAPLKCNTRSKAVVNFLRNKPDLLPNTSELIHEPTKTIVTYLSNKISYDRRVFAYLLPVRHCVTLNSTLKHKSARSSLSNTNAFE